LSSTFKPPDKEPLKKEYCIKYPLFGRLLEEVEFILSQNIKTQGLEISNLEVRIKDFESFYDKIVRKEIIIDPFEQIDDIAGARIIVLFRSDLEKIKDIVKEKFNVIEENLHDASKPFGYMSDHYIVKLPDRFKGARYDLIKSLKCEIQVRTVSMHAWATVSHHLTYKQEIDVPTEQKNSFNALGGVFYIADTLFELFQSTRNETITSLMDKVKKDQFNLDEEINLDTLKAYMLWKYPERRNPPDSRVSSLITEIRALKYDNFRTLNRLLDDTQEKMIQYERKNDLPNFFTRADAIRLIIRNFF